MPPANQQSQQQTAARAVFPRDTRMKHTYQRSDTSALSSSAASQPVPPLPSAPPTPTPYSQPDTQKSQSLSAVPISSGTPSPHRPLCPRGSADAISQVLYEREARRLETSTPIDENFILPPEYENARQPWEGRRDGFRRNFTLSFRMCCTSLQPPSRTFSWPFLALAIQNGNGPKYSGYEDIPH